MSKSDLFGKSLICTQDWNIDDLEKVLKLAFEMKAERFSERFTRLLEFRTFLMFFYNPSVRTRQSFEAAATELGGHAQFLEPKSMRLKTAKTAGETIEDAARVMSRYGCGLGIRILEDKISDYGAGDSLLREYEKYSDIPIINMADDKFHPMQGLADVMGLRMHLGQNLHGKKLLQVWGHGALARSWCSIQESILINSRLGLDVTLCYPEGYDLDPEVIEKVKENCKNAGTKFILTHEQEEGYKDADVVYSRNWMSPSAYDGGEFNKEKEIEKALKFPEWICNEDKMKLTNNALFIHPMPVDRGHEVSDIVASGPRSIIIDIAENRLHVQKAVMALTMSEKF
ncbi:MAG TPA: ornithine carbamoyltransferase [Firmicutes bacterium]|nr:ornithine carbamoyltransferase [Bacillota bacterium]